MEPVLKIKNISKDFLFHHQMGTRINVLDSFFMEFHKKSATVLSGPSGAGKSTLLKMIYANYKTESGSIEVLHKERFTDIVKAEPATIYDIRRYTIGYVSQFLRVVPRISALNTVIEPLIERGEEIRKAEKRGRELLERLRIPEKLWDIPASTFSGGEQQRVNLARGFVADYPVLLLDEPTASLDPKNRQTVLTLIKEAVEKGSSVIGVFHNRDDQEKVANQIINMEKFKASRR